MIPRQPHDMTTNVEICNLAISHCGASQFIASLNEPSNEARLCALHLPVLRRATLRDAPWGFATRRQTLALISSGTVSGWAYRYSLPSDCLAALAIVVPGSRAPRSEERIPFEVSASGLSTDQARAELIYTADIESPALFDALFVQTLAFGLAAEIAPALSASSGLAKMAADNYLRLMSRALAASLREGMESVPESSLISGRF